MRKQHNLFYYVAYRALTILGFTLAINELLIQQNGVALIGYFMIFVGVSGSYLSTQLEKKMELDFCKHSLLKELLVFILLMSFGMDILSLWNAFMGREYSVEVISMSALFFIIAFIGCLILGKKEARES